MNRILKRIGSRLRRRLDGDAPPLSSDAPPPDRMTEADYEAFKKERDTFHPWLGVTVAELALATGSSSQLEREVVAADADAVTVS